MIGFFSPDANLALGISITIVGMKGGSAVPFTGQGPIILPGMSENQEIILKSKEGAPVDLLIIAQAGYPPSTITMPTTLATTGVSGVWQTLTDQANIEWNLAAGNADVTIAGDRALGNPSNVEAGKQYFLQIIQDAVGGRHMTWGTDYKFPGGAPPMLSYRPNEIDVLEFQANLPEFIPEHERK